MLNKVRMILVQIFMAKGAGKYIMKKCATTMYYNECFEPFGAMQIVFHFLPGGAVFHEPHLILPSLPGADGSSANPVYFATGCPVQCLLQKLFPAAGRGTAGFICQAWLIRSGIPPAAALRTLFLSHLISLRDHSAPKGRKCREERDVISPIMPGARAAVEEIPPSLKFEVAMPDIQTVFA